MIYKEFVENVGLVLEYHTPESDKYAAILMATQDFNIKLLLGEDTKTWVKLWMKADKFTKKLHNNLGRYYVGNLPF